MVAKNLNTAVDKRRNIKTNNYPPVNRFNDYVLLVYFIDCLACFNPEEVIHEKEKRSKLIEHLSSTTNVKTSSLIEK